MKVAKEECITNEENEAVDAIIHVLNNEIIQQGKYRILYNIDYRIHPMIMVILINRQHMDRLCRLKEELTRTGSHIRKVRRRR